MRSPLEEGEWHQFDEVASTQDIAAHAVREGRGGVFLAASQTHGRGRLGRTWISEIGQSLTVSMAFRTYADHPRPYLVGMMVAIAAASVTRCELSWPNDLVAGDRKLGGILTELVPDERGRRIPVVGLGLNLNQTDFPTEIRDRATSLSLIHGGFYSARAITDAILAHLPSLPEPNAWSDLAPIWDLFDQTPGKRYRMVDGRVAAAIAIGSEGELIASVDGETVAILAAEAIQGPGRPRPADPR